MIIGIEAPMSAGKTLLMTKLLLQEHLERGRELLTNYNLLRRPHLRLNAPMLEGYVKGDIQLRNVAIGIDEVHLWVDSRMSMSARNRVLSYFFTQTSKNNINLYYTTQDLGMADKRLRAQTTVGINVSDVGNDTYRMIAVNRHTKRLMADVLFDGRPTYPEYDTTEVISFHDY